MPPVARRPFRAFMLAALLFGMGLAGLPSVAQQRVGVNSAVNPDATGIPPGAAPRRLVLGQEVVFNERITTGPEGQTQVLFVDQSTMTVGPRSELVIDEFVYDPNAGTGKLAASLTRGVFRFVGGKLSKQDNAVTMQTPSATIGIRGGLILVDLSPDGQLQVIFGYGAGVTVTGLNGLAQTITRPGFQVTVAGRGAAPSTPSPTPPGAAAALLAQLDGRPGGNGGGRTIPTHAGRHQLCGKFQEHEWTRHRSRAPRPGRDQQRRHRLFGWDLDLSPGLAAERGFHCYDRGGPAVDPATIHSGLLHPPGERRRNDQSVWPGDRNDIHVRRR